MMVLGKTRELGILMSLGATRWGIARIFLKQGGVIALGGTLLGDVLAFVVCSAQLEYRFFSLPSDIYFMTSVPIAMNWWHYAVVSGISVGLCFISALIPARLASRLNPVNAIRFA
jgi:lipoprotein-releasing system permease protein